LGRALSAQELDDLLSGLLHACEVQAPIRAQ
jgi:hypothetical protein